MDLPRPPEDQELRNIIDKLAQFVARNGAEFEQMTKNKQRDNLKFSFLFGGEYFNYYQYRVTTEQAISKHKAAREQSLPMGYPPASFGPPGSGGSCPPIGNQGFGPGYNKYPTAPGTGPGPGPMPAVPWTHPPPNISGPMPQSYPGQNPLPPPQADLMALNGAKEVLIAQQKQLQEQVKQSEQNLAAQHQVLMQQQKHQTEEALKQHEEKHLMQMAQDCGVNLVEFDHLLMPITESCTKESISQGKAWILGYAQQSNTSLDVITKFLLFKSTRSTQFIHKLHLVYLVNDVLHHCVRKGADSLLKALEQVVTQMFCCASLAANDEEQNSKLQKLLTLWQSKNNYLERGLLERLESPQQVWNEYQNSLRMQYSMAISNVSNNIQSTYENYRSQHQAFVNHATHQIQQLEQQRQQIEQQIAAATVQVVSPTTNPPFAPSAPIVSVPDFSRPPPFVGPHPTPSFPAEGIEPKAPYFDLPAGLMVPLIKIDSKEYKSIDPKAIRLPPPLPPSERLMAAVDSFYSPPSHDRPRNGEGWEQLALYEFYKNKSAAKKKREDDLSQGLREPTPPSSDAESDTETRREKKEVGPGKNGIKSPVRKRYRSESPGDDDDQKSTRRSRSSSPQERRSSKKRSDRSRSGSRSPSITRHRSRSRSPSRSDSRSSSPCQMPAFLRQRSPTPPTELASVAFTKGITQKLDESNRGHQLLRKMGWGGAGLGANEQGIAEPIKGGEVRDRVDQFKGVGIDTRDPFENFRKSKGQAFITRMRSRAEEREKEKTGEESASP